MAANIESIHRPSNFFGTKRAGAIQIALNSGLIKASAYKVIKSDGAKPSQNGWNNEMRHRMSVCRLC